MGNSISDRIFQLIDALGVSVANFSDETTIDRASLSHIKNGRSKPTLEMLKKIVCSYPRVSLDWLILGGGTMLKQSDDSHEPDLFTQFTTSVSNTVVKPIQTSQTTVQTKTDNEILPSISGENGALLSNKSASQVKQISKIVVFYSDNTFKELSGDILY